MSTLQLTVSKDGKVTRDGEDIATVDFESKEIEWGHWQFKKAHETEVVRLIESMGDDDVTEQPKEVTPEDANDIVEAMTSGAVEDPEPPKTSLGDRSPGYPEWFRRQHGEEAFKQRYHVRGMNRATGNRLNQE